MFDFLKRDKESSVGYSGSDTYKYIDELINDNGSELKIVTPYLGISYARKLLSISKRKRIRLIVSGDQNKKDEDAVKLLLNRGRRIDWKLAFFLVIAMVASAFIKVYLATLVFGLLLVLSIYLMYVLNPRGRRISVKISTRKFIHEKMYISDGKAIVGSANLTYSGTHRNVEHIEIIKGSRRIKELNEHFEDIWVKN